MRVSNVVLANLLLAQVIWAGTCFAQVPQGSTAAPPGQHGARRGPPRQTMHVGLQAMPSNMPVPVPPDAKFVTGYQSQYAGAKAMTYVRMTSENSPAALVDWYRKNLQSYGWTTREQAATKPTALPSLSGTKNGIMCLINFEAPSPRSGKNTAIMLTFNEPH